MLTLSSISLSVSPTVARTGTGAGGTTWLRRDVEGALLQCAIEGLGTRDPAAELGREMPYEDVARDERDAPLPLPLPLALSLPLPLPDEADGSIAGASLGGGWCTAAKCGLGIGRLSIGFVRVE